MIPLDFIKLLPKVELHDHLDGGVRLNTIIDIAKQHSIQLPSTDTNELAIFFHRGADKKNLTQYLEGFNITLKVMQTKEALTRIAYEAILDLHEDHVVYAEIRFAPILSTQKGLSINEVVESVIEGLTQGKMETGVEFGLILCAMRDQEAHISLETAKIAVSFRNKGVVGFDIAGDENGHPPKRHLKAFQYIREQNFHITIHAGEAFGPESIWQAIQVCGAHRIGHGTRLIEDMTFKDNTIISMGSLASFINNRRIPLECCLSSNIQTGAALSYEEHPFNLLYKNNFRVCLSTDNRLMSNTSLTKEIDIACRYYNLTVKDIEKITINAMKSAFISYKERVNIIYKILKPAYLSIKENYPRV